MSIYSTEVKTIQGNTETLASYEGKVLLVVNVASKCGLTPQYEELEALYKAEKEKGLEVLGFPCNQFLGQEPGSEEEIQQFCSVNYDVTFPMFAKVEVNGAGRHPLYQAMIAEQPVATQTEEKALLAKLGEMDLLPASENDVTWNFEKFLISRDGKVIGRFAPDMSVNHPVLKQAIEAAL